MTFYNNYVIIFNIESEVIHINIKDKFIETFGLEINEDNIATLLKTPIKKGKGVFTDLHNWKRCQDSPNSLLEDKALTLIFLKQYNYFKY